MWSFHSQEVIWQRRVHFWLLKQSCILRCHCLTGHWQVASLFSKLCLAVMRLGTCHGGCYDVPACCSHWSKNQVTNASSLCKSVKSKVTLPACLIKSYDTLQYLLHALVTTEARQCLATQITCCTHVNVLSGVQDMHSSLCGHSLDRRNKAWGLVSRGARGNCRQNAAAATGFTGLHPLWAESASLENRIRCKANGNGVLLVTCHGTCQPLAAFCWFTDIRLYVWCFIHFMWHTKIKYSCSTRTDVNHVADRLVPWLMQGRLFWRITAVNNCKRHSWFVMCCHCCAVRDVHVLSVGASSCVR